MSAEWPVVYAHGRIEWDEEAWADLEKRVMMDIRRAHRNRQRRSAAGLLLVALLAFAFLALGCATAPPRPEVLVLPEVAGSVSAKAIGALVGQSLSAEGKANR